MPCYQFRLRAGVGMNLATQIRECSDDYDAMTLAERLLEGGGLAHVWAGDRNVGQVFLPVAKSM